MANNEPENDYRQNPPPGMQGLGAIVNLMSHKGCYSDEKRKVATRAFGIMQIFGNPPARSKRRTEGVHFASIRMTRE